MSGLIELRSLPHLQPWQVAAVPYSYSEAGRQQFRAIPGCTWVRDAASPNGKGYYVGAREAVAIVARTLEAAKISKVQDLTDARWALRPPLELWGELRQYQRQGAAWLCDMLRFDGAALLADEMGLGKSAQAAVAAAALQPDRLVIVSPSIRGALPRKWRRELDRWGPLPADLPASIYSYEGFASAMKRGDVPAAQLLVVDEIHYCANPKALRTKAILAWLSQQQRRPGVIALSGTPMADRPRDLWQPLDLLWPGRFGRAWDFQNRYCAGRWEEIEKLRKKVWVADGISRAPELQERLGAVMLRRLKRDVAADLPSLTREMIELDLPAAARRALARAQAACGPDAQSLQSLLSAVEQHKIQAACDLAADLMAAGGRPLILTTRKASAYAIGRQLGCPAVTGDDAGDRAQILQCGDGAAAATIYSITTGIDLVAFDSIIMVGLDWCPSTLRQAEDRIHRIGQSRACSIYYLIGLGTLDELVRDRVLGKLDSFVSVLGDAADLGAALSGGDDDQLLAELVAGLKGDQA